MLFADASTIAEQLPAWLTPIVGGSFTAWYAWYMTSVVQPRKDAESLAERQKMQAEFAEERAAAKVERQHAAAEFVASLRAVTDHCEQEISRIDGRWAEIFKLQASRE